MSAGFRRFMQSLWLSWQLRLTKYKPWTLSTLVTNLLLTAHLRTMEANGVFEVVCIFISIHCWQYENLLKISALCSWKKKKNLTAAKEYLESSVFAHIFLFYFCSISSIFKNYFICVGLLSACRSVHCMSVWCPHRPGQGSISPGTGVTDGLTATMWMLGILPSGRAEPSLQLHSVL